jgi:hypothetical protein
MPFLDTGVVVILCAAMPFFNAHMAASRIIAKAAMLTLAVVSTSRLLMPFPIYRFTC